MNGLYLILHDWDARITHLYGYACNMHVVIIYIRDMHVLVHYIHIIIMVYALTNLLYYIMF